jgi:DNA mismatch endonuclease (patch repair protein)
MSMIRAKNTKPEVLVHRELRRAKFGGYRTNSKLEGKPDLVFPAQKLAVFIDGCFWHRCPRHYKTPQTRREFWTKKINKNVVRDREVDLALKSAGWDVLRIWEHEVRKSPNRATSPILERLNLLRSRP